MARPVLLCDPSHFLAGWRNEMSDCKQQQACAGDEIDLIELAQAIWAEKVLVLAFTVATTLAALAYSFAVSPQYASQAVISPAIIDTFGSLAEALGARQRDSETFGIKAGAQIANDAFSVLTTNLRSPSEQRAFRESFQAEGPFELIPALPQTPLQSQQQQARRKYPETPLNNISLTSPELPVFSSTVISQGWVSVSELNLVLYIVWSSQQLLIQRQ